jgi:hypothetical protein
VGLATVVRLPRPGRQSAVTSLPRRLWLLSGWLRRTGREGLAGTWQQIQGRIEDLYT